MCGIVGFISLRPGVSIDKEEILSMTNSIAHRGPNDHGCVLIENETNRTAAFKYADEPIPFRQGDVGLGNRRLSIIDLTAGGHQPMGEPGGQVWMTYNGEIYNYVELRQTLERIGYQFNSSSDTEVVLTSYLHWGVECFEKLNGMWAIALFDMRRQQLILSRDRFGKKPLFYFKDHDVFVFGSEIKALLRHPRVPKTINLKKIGDYAGRHYRFVDDNEETFFKDIHQVPKSSHMIVDRSGEIQTEKYWNLRASESLATNEDEIVEEFRSLLKNAVQIRLRSDVPLGVMLSGGLDSTSILCLAADQNVPVTAFCGVTGDGYYDESEYMKEVLQRTGAPYKFIYPQAAPLVETLREMLAYHDEPVCTVTWYSMYLMTRSVAQHGIPVVLTGHGGDELVAGYWDHYHYNFADLRASGLSDSEERQAWLANHERPAEEYNIEKEFLDKSDREPLLRTQRFSRYLDALLPEVRIHQRLSENSAPFKGKLVRRLYRELMFETIPPSLRAEDRNMMAHSTENRVPFLDYRLAEFCFRLPNCYKIRHGLGKWLLREAMKGYLPEKVRLRKEKVGFNAPVDAWFRNEVRHDLERMIDSDAFVNKHIYDQKVVRNYFQEHLSNTNHAMFLWQYINLYIWCESVVDIE